MTSDHRFNEWLEATRKAYNAPPETPRDAIWDAIEAELVAASPEQVLTGMREDYQRPPDTPREEMWGAIEAALPGTPGEVADVVSLGEVRQTRDARKPVWRRQWTGLATAAAALLVLGVGLGRMSMTPVQAPVGTPVGTPTEVAADGAAEGPFRAVAVDYLTRTESVLSLVSSDARAGRIDAEVSQWGRTLLLQTRLLLDSPAAQDQVIRELLEDLEVILIQVARLSPGQFDEGVRGDELDLINEGLDDNDMMLRIRSVLPTGTIQAGI